LPRLQCAGQPGKASRKSSWTPGTPTPWWVVLALLGLLRICGTNLPVDEVFCKKSIYRDILGINIHNLGYPKDIPQLCGLNHVYKGYTWDKHGINIYNLAYARDIPGISHNYVEIKQIFRG
jgi:hypothetical protein